VLSFGHVPSIVSRIAQSISASALGLRWKGAARALGLHWHPDTGRMSGYIDERFVAATNSGDWIVSVALWPPLDLVLGQGVPTDEWSRNAAMHAVVRRSQGLMSVTLRKDFLHVETWHQVWTHSQLRALVDRGLALAGAVDAARNAIPDSATALGLFETFHDVARARHMTLRRTPLGYHGAQRKIGLEFFLAREGLEWLLIAFARFRTPLGIGFNARSRRMGLSEPWGLTPLRTGDAEFDQWFTVSAFETAYVRQALSPAARHRLSELAERGMWIVVHDLGIVVELRIPSPETLNALLDELCRISELVDFTLPKSAAYR
jgi:hypothetical protein